MALDNTTTRLEFPAQVIVPADDAQEEVFASVRFNEHDPRSLEVELHLLGSEDQRMRVYSYLHQIKQSNFWIHGAGAAADINVEVLALSSEGAAGRGSVVERITLPCGAVQINITKATQESESAFWVIIQLVPSGILIQPKHVAASPDGNITREVPDWGKGEITVATPVGTFRVREYYDYFDSKEYGNSVTHQVQRAVIEGKIAVHAGESLFDIHEALLPIVGGICSILSLCCRVPVDYYGITYQALVDENASLAPAPSLRRRLLGTRPDPHRELINFRDLVEGGLDQLYQAFVACQDAATIQRVLAFLSGSYASDALEESYFLAFAALETTISAAASPETAYTMRKKPFDQLRKHLETVITNFLSEGQPRVALEPVLEKLPELRRPAIKRRIADVVQRLDVITSDLWVSLGFEEGFKRAYDNRNALVHDARVDNSDELERDRVRLWILAERIVLRMLDWPQEKIWRWYDQPLRWVNRLDA